VIAFDFFWAVTVFLCVRALATRLLAVRIGPLGAALAAALAIAGGVGAQSTIDGGSRGVGPYLVFAGLSLLITMAVVAAVGMLSRPAVTPNRVMSGIPHPLRHLRARASTAPAAISGCSGSAPVTGSGR
jgi:hypothetical protein